MAQLNGLIVTGSIKLGTNEDTGSAGNLWFDPSVNRLKYSYGQPGASTWSAGGALITARFGLAGAGTQNAGLAFGGYTPSVVSCTEEYSGTSWSAGGALSTARRGSRSRYTKCRISIWRLYSYYSFMYRRI